jgi:hypothetical protein
MTTYLTISLHEGFFTGELDDMSLEGRPPRAASANRP